MRLGVAGDWHGNRMWALRCVLALADAGVGEIFHLGDFGIWSGSRGRDYLIDLTDAVKPAERGRDRCPDEPDDD